MNRDERRRLDSALDLATAKVGVTLFPHRMPARERPLQLDE
jgi:hypothetical protein